MIRSAPPSIAGQTRSKASRTAYGSPRSAGTVELFGGRLDVAGALTNAGSTGTIEGDGSLFTASLSNEANSSIAFNAATSIVGDVSNLGSMAILGAANLTLFDDVVQNGVLQIGDASRAIVFGDFSGTGGTSGAGTLEVAGTLSPGASPASVSFGGDLVLNAQTSTLFEFAGDQPGEFDQLVAGGTVSLDGSVDLALLDGYVPPDGTSFPVVQAASVAGEFTDLPEGALVANVGGADFFIHYAPQEVMLTVPEPGGALLLAAGIPLLEMLARRRTRRALAASH
jgi:hypothetical protein